MQNCERLIGFCFGWRRLCWSALNREYQLVFNLLIFTEQQVLYYILNDNKFVPIHRNPLIQRKILVKLQQ